jgi:hypothetical protein
MTIKPEGFDRMHMRDEKIHRLRSDQGKWKALGIGDDEGETNKD